MATPTKRYPGNAAGEFYVDSTCIDCDLCRQIAPGVFRAEGDHSVVRRQPSGEDETRRAEMALVTCPTASIGTATKRPLARAIAAYPERVADNVYFCGFASEASYGASSYLVVRRDGNVLVDSPRFTEPLVRRLQQMGGVRFMFLTHRDDVADHDQFRRRFGCERVMHVDDATFPVERLVRGEERLADDLVVIPTPGHTRGHAVLHHGRFLFTGDHVWGDRDTGELDASRS